MQAKRMLIAALALAAGAALAHADAALDEIEAQVREAWKQHDTLSADLRLEAALPIGANRLEVAGQGTLHHANMGERGRYRQQMTLNLPEPMTARLELDVLYDGRELHITTDIMGRRDRSREDFDLSRGAAPPGGGLLFDVLKENLALTVLDAQEIDGAPVHVIQGVPSGPGAAQEFQRGLFYIDKEIGLLRKVELFETEPVATATLTASNPRINPDIDPATFALDAAPEPDADDEEVAEEEAADDEEADDE